MFDCRSGQLSSSSRRFRDFSSNTSGNRASSLINTSGRTPSDEKLESLRTSRPRTTHADPVAPFSRRINRSIYLPRLSRASHDWCAQFPFSVERRRRFNINDRIKELGTLLPKTNDPWVRISLFFRRARLFPPPPRFLLVARSRVLSLCPSPIATPFFVVLLFFAFAFCTFPTDHYFLFVTLYDELVQVRCSRREAFTGSPFFAPSTLLSFALLPSSPAGSPRLLVLPAFTSALFPVLPGAQSATLSRLGCSSARWMKANGRGKSDAANRKYEETGLRKASLFIPRITACSDNVKHTRSRVLHEVFYKINLQHSIFFLCNLEKFSLILKLRKHNLENDIFSWICYESEFYYNIIISGRFIRTTNIH